jgi:hypothetical protein
LPQQQARRIVPRRRNQDTRQELPERNLHLALFISFIRVATPRRCIFLELTNQGER